jgi:hypothetical protein
VPVQVLAGAVVSHGGARVAVPGGDLHITQVHPSIEHGGHERVAEHVWMHPGQPDTSDLGEPSEPPGGGVPVHPSSARVQQDRPGDTCSDRTVDRPRDRRWQRHQHHLGALADHPQHAVAVFIARSVTSAPVASKIRSPSRLSIATRAKSLVFGDSRAAVSSASNCRWVRPRVGDSGGTVGLRPYSAGEWSETPSMTQVR